MAFWNRLWSNRKKIERIARLAVDIIKAMRKADPQKVEKLLRDNADVLFERAVRLAADKLGISVYEKEVREAVALPLLRDAFHDLGTEAQKLLDNLERLKTEGKLK